MKAALPIAILIPLFAGAVSTAGADFSAILSGGGQDYATSVTSDAQGNVYVGGLTYSPDFPVTAGAAQTTFGRTSDAFIAKLGPDGKLIWATYLGGILDDWVTGLALDSAGNVLVAGYTRSPDFPLVHPVQNLLNNNPTPTGYNAFVAKLDPKGSKLLYSTFLGAVGNSGAAGIAVDAAGNAVVAVTVQSAAGFPGTNNLPDQPGIVVTKLSPTGALIYSYYHPYGAAAAIGLDAAGSVYVAGTVYPNQGGGVTHSFGPPGNSEAMVFKLSTDGSKKIYETTLGGSVEASGTAIAVNNAGEAWVAGSTSSVDFPLMHPLQNTTGARPLWKSADSGATWTPLDGLPFALPQALVVDATTPTTVYAATKDLGIFKSLDGGVTWTGANSGISGTNIQALAIDPVHPQTLYAATTPPDTRSPSLVYKTVDGARTWTMIDSSPTRPSQLAVDAQNPNIVWEISGSLRRSTDGGATWNPVTFPAGVANMALDPRVSGHLFASSTFIFCSFNCSGNTPSTPYLYLSNDGGANWNRVNSVPPLSPGLTVDASTNPSTLYDGLSFRSVDGGASWTPIVPPAGAESLPATYAVDPAGTVYAEYSNGLFVSRDHAQTWTVAGNFYARSIVPAGATGTLYSMVSQSGATGFVARLSADGSSIVYSTYLRGHATNMSSPIVSAEPAVFTTQNWISAIALDAAGNATVAGGTHAVDLPLVAPAQAANAGLADAFAATIAADGSKLTYSTYFGGSRDDGALGVALDSQGNVLVVGQTFSGDFPVVDGTQRPYTYGDAFVVKLAPPGQPAITSVLNGASYRPGIEAGSWVEIQGVNLANTFPGRKWRDDEIVNGKLPTSLDGVSVTIDGKPAFVYYISPTQINVQAPSGSATGPVNVVVTNNGNASAPATAQLQAAAPAFFMYGATNYAIASRLPDYALVGDPSAIPGTVAAKPGDIVVLWGTGFGATDPAVAAGSPVSGAPTLVTAPTVTVGGAPAQVISAVLTTGTAGLYQVTIQLPSALPAGAVAVQASVGGAQTQAGALLFVSAQ